MNDSSTIDQLEDRYNQFVSILTSTAQNTLVKKKAYQKWMTQDILLEMVKRRIEKRRMAKSNADKYNTPDIEVRSECQMAK